MIYHPGPSGLPSCSRRGVVRLYPAQLPAALAVVFRDEIIETVTT